VAAPKESPFFPEWDYLIVTASNDRQAEAYRIRIGLRQSLGFLSGIKKILVIPDPGGRRVGSGGSTVHCLFRILRLELGAKRVAGRAADPKAWLAVFDRLRILIVHAGGDSRRLPPYGPCGKIFVPVPGEAGGAAGTTLFDRLIPTYLRLPKPWSGGGQLVVASGDVLLDFEASSVVFADKGVTGVGAFVSPDLARNHGVYCREESNEVRAFLQKPSPARQQALGAVNAQGQSVLDLGILNFSPEGSVRLLELCGTGGGGRHLTGRGPVGRAIESAGLDIYREVCCALGRDVRPASYAERVREAGSPLEADVLRAVFRGLRPLPFHVHVVPRFRFLHFGTLRDLIDSGRSLLDSDASEPVKDPDIVVDSLARGPGLVEGANAWIEGCRIDAPLSLAGGNIVVGLDVGTPLALPPGGSLDVLAGRGRDGRAGWFVRAYRTEDVFHLPAGKGGRLWGRPCLECLAALGAGPEDVWPSKLADGERAVWNGRFFPIVRDEGGYRDWVWMLEPEKATAEQKALWLAAERYSLEEMAVLADLEAFHSRRLSIRSSLALGSLARSFGPEGDLSAAEIAFLVRGAPAGHLADWVVAMAREAARRYDGSRRLRGGLDALGVSRVLHASGSVLRLLGEADAGGKAAAAPRRTGRGALAALKALETSLSAAERRAFREMGAPVESASRPLMWAAELREAAFRHMGRTIVRRGGPPPPPPRNVLRGDEIVWGRAPARLDLGGGWTDTPPYSLERGGCVINAAVELNGQAPIQAYARVIDKPEIRINSIDHSARAVARSLEDLADYRRPGSRFALAKAALALSGFAPGAAAWPAGTRTLEAMLRRFGGGIELTTLAAIPSGSGLGTSSIMGAVLMSVIGRMAGRPLSPRDLFDAVLRLEQELTTGGGWQDQIGGAVEGVKLIEADKGLVPDPRVRFVPADLLDPAANGGRTLLYYTGLRRLAKNILHEVVGRYLDRDRGAMETLRRLHAFPPLMAEAMGMRDAERFGRLIDLAWRLNVDLDPGHTTPVIEDLRRRIGPHVLGAKLLGAGGGGFLLMACKSAEDAGAVRTMLEKRPPNDKARFFDYSISRRGLVVTVC